MDWSQQEPRYRELKNEYLGLELANLMDISRGTSFEAMMAAHLVGNRLLQGHKAPEGTSANVLEWYHSAADRGFVVSDYNLGVCHEYGFGGTPKNFNHALYHYCRAAEGNHPMSLVKMAGFYFLGLWTNIKGDNLRQLSDARIPFEPHDVFIRISQNFKVADDYLDRAMQAAKTLCEEDRRKVAEEICKLCNKELLLQKLLQKVKPSDPFFKKNPISSSPQP